MKTPPTQKAIEGAPDKANSNSTNILERHFCYCRPRVPCIFCLPNKYQIRWIEATTVMRRAAA
jgi:hypothetical protein